MKTVVLAVLGVSAVLLLGCGSKELSRSKAADLIGSNKEFGTPWEIEIPVGNFWWDSRELGAFPAPLQTLIAANIWTVRESGQEVGGSLLWYREYLSGLTPHGKDLSKTWAPTKENIASANVGPSCYFIVASMRMMNPVIRPMGLSIPWSAHVGSYAKSLG